MSNDVYFEDVVLGSAFSTRSHQVTEDDILKFADLTFDRHPLHTDADYSQTTTFGRQIAHGLYGLALLERLKSELGFYEKTSIASLGYAHILMPKPVYIGDIVHGRMSFLSKRLSISGPNGIDCR